MRLIDADVLIEEMKKTETEYENAMTCPSWLSAFNVISEQPTAYDIDKVVEELEDLQTYNMRLATLMSDLQKMVFIDIIFVVKMQLKSSNRAVLLMMCASGH